MMNDICTLEISQLATVTGGVGPSSAAPPDDAAPRTWKDVGKDYAQACIEGAGEGLMFGGKPRNMKAAAFTAGTGCVMGLGMKGLEDGTNKLLGR